MKKKSFMTLTEGVNIIKLFFSRQCFRGKIS
jgi:hypothetical protein